MARLATSALVLAVASAVAAPGPVWAQRMEGDALSPTERWGRMRAEPGTFWLDGNEDREIIRYSTPRDVRLCLPRAKGVGAADRAYPITVTWDGTTRATLYPGNCLFFDARQVTLKPAAELPRGVTLTGQVETSRAPGG